MMDTIKEYQRRLIIREILSFNVTNLLSFLKMRYENTSTTEDIPVEN